MKGLNILISVINILFSKNGGLKYLSSNTRSIASFGILEKCNTIVPDLKSIIDVGANIGQFGVACSKFYPNAQIYCFEPVPETFEKLKSNTEGTKNIKVYHSALGNADGTIDFFQNEHSHASSALEVSKEQKEAIPETATYKKISVQVEKLDNFIFSKKLEEPIFLKLDVQGFEKQVLLGADLFLNSVDYLLLEMSFVPMYENEPLFDEMHDYIRNKGFKLISPVGVLPTNSNQILQMDMLYQRIKI
ncbi:MAG: FkbM family methyltransferase [Bacteroidota bacterium]